MNESIKKQTVEFHEKLIASLANKAVTDLIEKTVKASDGDSGNFEVVVSTSDVDRQGESVDQNGWDLTYFKANPVVLWAHDYGSLPIGVCTSIEVVMGKLTAKGKFAPEDANPFAQQVRRLYDLGMVRATSVGFIPKDFDDVTMGKITKAELLEFSFVPVPANPHALTVNQIKELKLDTMLLKTKGIEITGKDPQAGDRCALPDGSEGVLGTNPNDPNGAMICIPEKEENEDDVDTDAAKILSELKGISERLDKIEKHMQTKTVALEAEPALDGDKGGAGDDTAAKGRKTSEAAELDVFIETRQVLRSIDNIVGDALETLNVRARQHASAK